MDKIDDFDYEREDTKGAGSDMDKLVISCHESLGTPTGFSESREESVGRKVVIEPPSKEILVEYAEIGPEENVPVELAFDSRYALLSE